MQIQFTANNDVETLALDHWLEENEWGGVLISRDANAGYLAEGVITGNGTLLVAVTPKDDTGEDCYRDTKVEAIVMLDAAIKSAAAAIMGAS